MSDKIKFKIGDIVRIKSTTLDGRYYHLNKNILYKICDINIEKYSQPSYFIRSYSKDITDVFENELEFSDVGIKCRIKNEKRYEN